MTINFRWLKSDPIIEKEEMEREIFWLSDVCKLKTGIRVGCYNIYPQSVIMIYWTAKRWRLGVSRFPMAAECLWFFCFVSFQVFVSMTDVRDAGARFRRIKKKETVRYILVDVDIQMGAGGNPLSCSGATEHHEYHSCLSKCLFCASRFNKRTRQFWKASIPISDLSWFTPIKWKGMKQRAAQLPIIQRPWKPWNFGNIPGGTVYKSLSRAKWQSSNKIVREFSSWRSIKGRKPLISCRLGVTSMNRHMNDLKLSLWNDPDSTDLGLVDQWMNDSINMNDLRRYLVSFSLWNGLKAKRERRSWSLAVLESNQTVTMSNWLVIYRIHQIYRVQCWLS